MDQYFSALCKLNETSEDVLIFESDVNMDDLEKEIEQEKENTRKRIYDFFSEDYINETGLTIDNIQTKLGNYNDVYVQIEDMYIKDVTITLRLYFVSGCLIEKETLDAENFELVIALDYGNSTFNIYTSDYLQNHNLDDSNEEINFDEIEKRTYNKYEYIILNDEEYAKELLKSYTQSIKYNDINYSYSRLNEEYMKNKFNEIIDYEKYVEQNKKSIITATLNYYKYNVCDGYIQYICIDQNGKYYIFNELATMDYELMLDIYTIDTVEFTSKYESATTEEKVMLNIQKIVEALNAEDYNYIYGKLADEFKENYFNTYEEFEKYAEETFDIANEVVYNKYTESDTLSTYEITLEGKNKTITKTIVMRLEEGTDFVMSFNVK